MLANSPYKTIADVLVGARKEPGAVSYGTSGIGSIPIWAPPTSRPRPRCS
ncbi:hypothetical protein H0I39_20505 [Ottowia beijingensis]|uniref:Uncharacterized protein n=1 Tax=Ottowia beijingensis TaxID=1207057 RepID=A0A853IZT1_9BURK|nr:hypothetical protein [Ottowia beijingensis]NZA03451.1 hypothetical protein [Ottowia beijingensis]NZA03456.1 hypothetical protein [Ottowia beijingensis]